MVGPDDVVYVVTTGQIAYAVEQTSGAQLWNYTTAGRFLGVGALSTSGLLVLPEINAQSTLTALDAQTGHVVWLAYMTIDPWMFVPPVVDGIHAYIGTGDGQMAAVSLIDGSWQWGFSIPAPSGTGEEEFYASAVAVQAPTLSPDGESLFFPVGGPSPLLVFVRVP